MNLITIAMYQFIPLENLLELRVTVKQKCLDLGLKGTILLAPEGVNCFIAGQAEQIAEFKPYIETQLNLKNPSYKENLCHKSPFNRMLVKLKKEIISIGNPDIRPTVLTAPYMPPRQLKDWLDQGKEFVLLDTRNEYEVTVGTFEKATHLRLNSFREITQATEKLPVEMKEKPVVMFCTGGIRCEKASALFMKSGFKEVYQLEGGILKYFEDCQDAHYTGNCFVFDWRLAVNAQLEPTYRDPKDPATTGRHQVKD
jgi:UPF0176 protein